MIGCGSVPLKSYIFELLLVLNNGSSPTYHSKSNVDAFFVMEYFFCSHSKDSSPFLGSQSSMSVFLWCWLHSAFSMVLFKPKCPMLLKVLKLVDLYLLILIAYRPLLTACCGRHTTRLHTFIFLAYREILCCVIRRGPQDWVFASGMWTVLMYATCMLRSALRPLRDLCLCHREFGGCVSPMA